MRGSGGYALEARVRDLEPNFFFFLSFFFSPFRSASEGGKPGATTGLAPPGTNTESCESWARCSNRIRCIAIPMRSCSSSSVSKPSSTSGLKPQFGHSIGSQVGPDRHPVSPGHHGEHSTRGRVYSTWHRAAECVRETVQKRLKLSKSCRTTRRCTAGPRAQMRCAAAMRPARAAVIAADPSKSASGRRTRG